MNYKKKEIENCNFAKAILMMVVVFYHSINFWNGNWFNVVPMYRESYILPILAKWLNTFHIYCFTFISGYIYYYIKKEKNKYADFKIFLTKKIYRLIIPYCSTALLWVIPITQIFYKYSVKEIIYKYILATSPSQLWFLLMLFWVFVFFWKVSDYNSDKVVLIFSLSCYLVGTIFAFLLPNFFCIFTGLQYVLYFSLGYLYRKHYYKINIKRIGIISVVFNIILFILSQKINNKWLAYIVIQLAHISGAVGFYGILQIIADKFDWRRLRVVNIFMKYSMTIYLFHQQIIYFVIYFLNGRILPEINALINFIIAIILSIFVSILLSKNRITRKMFSIG